MRTRQLIFLSVIMMWGCATDVERQRSIQAGERGQTHDRELQERYRSLAEKGKYTQATILSSLYDTSSLDMMPLDSLMGKKNEETLVSKAEGIESEAVSKKESLSELLPGITPLKVRLPPEQTKRTDLDEQWHAELGWSLLVDGKYEAAVSAYREALRQDRNLAEAYLGLGISLRMQNHIPAAIEAYEYALELKPNYAAALVHLGYIYADGEQEHRDIKKAKQLFHRAAQQGDPFAMIALRDLKTR